MNENYDAYLLYEYMKKVSFTVRILVKLKENVDPEVLNEEGLPYTVSEMKTRYLPDIELPKG